MAEREDEEEPVVGTFTPSGYDSPDAPTDSGDTEGREYGYPNKISVRPPEILIGEDGAFPQVLTSEYGTGLSLQHPEGHRHD